MKGCRVQKYSKSTALGLCSRLSGKKKNTIGPSNEKMNGSNNNYARRASPHGRASLSFKPRWQNKPLDGHTSPVKVTTKRYRETPAAATPLPFRPASIVTPVAGSFGSESSYAIAPSSCAIAIVCHRTRLLLRRIASRTLAPQRIMTVSPDFWNANCPPRSNRYPKATRS